MPLSQLPALLSAWLADLTAALDRRSAPRLLLLLVGALFAKGRRTVTCGLAGSPVYRPALAQMTTATRDQHFHRACSAHVIWRVRCD